jgi:probable rRNA maturation factor
MRPNSPAVLLAKPPLTLSLQFGQFADVATHRAALPRARVAAWLRMALAAPAELTVRVVRGKDYATNVLTFDYAQQPLVLADLVLCGPVVAAEAQTQGKTLDSHYAHLLVHGALHAQGYDHETGEPDALQMEALEILLLGALGFGCPY